MLDGQLCKQASISILVLGVVGTLIWSSSVGTPQSHHIEPEPPVPPSPDRPSPPEGAFGEYYTGINPDSPGLKADLTALLYPRPTVLTYGQVWGAYSSTDNDDFDCREVSGSGTVPCPVRCGVCQASCPLKCGRSDLIDMYSAKCWHFRDDQCGAHGYRKEGDCYNREHSWPKSWWGGSHAVSTPYTDLHHLVPTDGKVNAMRSNWPFGIVDGAVTYESSNHAKLGSCTAAKNYGWAGTCFEPPDLYKGDLARGYFYIATAYAGQLEDTGSTAAVHGSQIAKWQDELLRAWHTADPVLGSVDSSLMPLDVRYPRRSARGMALYRPGRAIGILSSTSPNGWIRSISSKAQLPVIKCIAKPQQQVPPPHHPQQTHSVYVGSAVRFALAGEPGTRIASNFQGAYGVQTLVTAQPSHYLVLDAADMGIIKSQSKCDLQCYM